MTPERARELVERALIDIVPDAELTGLATDADIREYLELDSLDFVELVERLSKAAGCRIEEEDYDELRTMDGAVALLVARAGATL